MNTHMHYVGRFAPSPTGPLHMGSLVTALASYLDAKAHDGKWLLRIEDVDTGRCRAHFVEDIKHCLTAHGLLWHEQPVIQSQQYARYDAILQQLHALKVVYACACTRADIARAHEIPNADTAIRTETLHEKNYPGTCKHGMPHGKAQRTWRIAFAHETIVWHDRYLKTQHDNPAQCVGDLVLKHIDGPWAYALAVVADDAASGVTHVVRGMDLKNSTSAQLQMFSWLQKPHPKYLHIPILCNHDGRKLSKQNGAAAINPDTPLDNLNLAWQYLGTCFANADVKHNKETIQMMHVNHAFTNGPFQRISALNPKEWLEKATHTWGEWCKDL